MIFSTLGLTIAGAQGTHVFGHADTLSHCDTLIWRPAETFATLGAALEGKHSTIINPAASERLLASSRHWRQQFRTLLNSGGTLVILLGTPHATRIHTLQEVMDYRWDEPLSPLHIPSAELTSPNALDPSSAGEPFRSFFEETVGLFMPQVELIQAPGTHVLRTVQKAALATYLSQPPGRILVLPEIDPKSLSSQRDTTRLIRALEHCISQLDRGSGIRLSGWLFECPSLSKRELSEQRSTRVQQRQKLDEQISNLEQAIAEQNFLCQIIGGEGPGVIAATVETFRRKGTFVHNDWLRSDLFIAETEDYNLMVKIGLTGESYDDAMLTELAQARERIQDYFGKRTRVLIVDCAQNRLPPHQREYPFPPIAWQQAFDAQILDSAQFFGWAFDPKSGSATALMTGLDTPHNVSFRQHLLTTAIGQFGKP